MTFRIQNPVLETSAVELFRDFFFFFFFCWKINKKTPLPEPLFNKVIGFYPATSLKEKAPIQVFSDTFARYLRHLFY